MKVLFVGGQSLLARQARPVFELFAEVVTAGRNGCDLEFDLAWPTDRMALPTDVDIVVNFAAHFGGADFTAMLAASDINATGALRLAQACKGAGVGQLVQISSIFASLDEISPFFNVYSLSKRQGEELLALYCSSAKLPLTILRPSQLYGSGDGFRRHQPFVYSLLDKAQRNEDIVLFGKNDALRNIIHVDDVAQVIARLVQLRVQGLHTCSSPSNVRFSEIASTAIGAFSSQSKVRFDRSRPDIPDNAFPSDDALYRLIDFFPQITLSQGFAQEALRRRSLE